MFPVTNAFPPIAAWVQPSEVASHPPYGSILCTNRTKQACSTAIREVVGVALISASSRWTNQRNSLIRARAMHISSWGNRSLQMRPSSTSCRPRPATSQTTHARWLDGLSFLRSSSYSCSSSASRPSGLWGLHPSASGGLPDSAPCFYLKLSMKLPPGWLVPLPFILPSLCQPNSQIVIANRGSCPIAFPSASRLFLSKSSLTLKSSSYTLVIQHPSSIILIHSNCAFHELLHNYRTSSTHAHKKQ